MLAAEMVFMNKRVALVGYGYWGPNLLRNLFDTPGCDVVYCCDQDEKKLELVGKRYPGIKLTSSFDAVIKDQTIDAVVLVTPTKTHWPLARRAIKYGKDVLLEKPMTATATEARKLTALARKNKRIVMVDHTFLFNPAVTLIKKTIESGDLGGILYIDSIRVNLGLFQKDANVIFDLASHDFSIINYLLGTSPKSVSASANIHFGKNEDVAHVFADYPKGISAHVHVSWLSPVKIRQMLIVGSKKMIVYDDIEPTEKVKVYDSGVVARKLRGEVEQMKIGYRTGDVLIPKIDIVEPLSLLAKEFINALNTRGEPKSSGVFGAEVVNILESATKSARTGRGVLLKNANKSRS